jgi:hypothetical protein
MVLNWLGGNTREDSVEELIRRKRFDRAIPLLKAELEKRKTDRRLRMKLGEVLLAAGHKPEGLKILRRLSDELALSGQAGQAIAILKKIEAADPGREDIEERLAYLVEQKKRPASDPWAKEDELEIGFEPNAISAEAIATPIAPLPSAPLPAAAPAAPAGPQPSIPAAAVSQGRVSVRQAPLEPPPAADPLPGFAAEPAAGGGLEAEEEDDDVLRDELLSVIEDTLRPVKAAAQPPEKAVETPLFRSLTQAELAALIRGLRLLTFEPGEIIVAEGEPGASLFLLTSGRVRAYVRNAASHMVQVRELQEGDFFGEISVLRGQARSATVTAAARCELLELDRATLERITAKHPNVRNVLEDFCEQRADNTLETMIRGLELR